MPAATFSSTLAAASGRASTESRRMPYSFGLAFSLLCVSSWAYTIITGSRFGFVSKSVWSRIVFSPGMAAPWMARPPTGAPSIQMTLTPILSETSLTAPTAALGGGSTARNPAYASPRLAIAFRTASASCALVVGWLVARSGFTGCWLAVAASGAAGAVPIWASNTEGPCAASGFSSGFTGGALGSTGTAGTA